MNSIVAQAQPRDWFVAGVFTGMVGCVALIAAVIAWELL